MNQVDDQFVDITNRGIIERSCNVTVLQVKPGFGCYSKISAFFFLVISRLIALPAL